MKLEDMILESVSLFLDEFSDPIKETLSIVSEIRDAYSKGLLTAWEFYAFLRNVVLRLPLSDTYIRSLAELDEYLLKLSENPKTKYTIAKTREAKIALTRFALKVLILQGSCLDRLRKAKMIEKKIKELEIQDASTLVRIYLSLALTYSSIGFFEYALKMASKALRIASFSVNFPEVLFVLDNILSRYYEAPRLSEDERSEIQTLRGVSKDLLKLFNARFLDDQELAVDHIHSLINSLKKNARGEQRKLVYELAHVLSRYLKLFASRASRP